MKRKRDGSVLILWTLRERQSRAVLVRDQELDSIFNRPLYAELGVVPRKRPLVLRRVEVRALVLKLRDLGEHIEAMGKSGRYPQLPLVLSCQLETHPLLERR